MKAAEFEYHRPETVEAALALLAAGDAVALAGGQSLMPMMNFRVAMPGALVDLGGLEELAGVSLADGWLTIGAMTRYHMLEKSAEISEAAPLIQRVLPDIAHAAIRNRGTIGGSCALADPAAEMPALMLALGGRLTVARQNGSRWIGVDDFFRGLYETARAEDELLVSVHIPAATGGQRHGFHEITRRHGDYAMAGCIAVAQEGLRDVRLAFFGISDRAVRARGAEAALTGSDGGAAALEAAVAVLSEIPFDGDLHASAAMKQHLAGVALRRAWAEVMA